MATLIMVKKGIVCHRLEGFRGREDVRLALEDIKLIYNQRYNTHTASLIQIDPEFAAG
ncbi:hypothetical protein [Nostoc sp. PA-18-2419]|uniref:hypothetical protein n=1 Tax=Nostoc sp. PA-18-2419 TaxID=2575443 RepID=UPI00167BDB5A|nr:hypothetical protein [Nostoc sp. PA-18-2419]